jgi:hypothetical protein
MAKFRDFVARQLPGTKVRRGSTPVVKSSPAIGQLPNSLIRNALRFTVMRITFDEASDK